MFSHMTSRNVAPSLCRAVKSDGSCGTGGQTVKARGLLWSALALSLMTLNLSAQDKGSAPPGLALTREDVRVVPRDDGFHLLIRQKPGLSSVMLTEAFELPDHKLATYSWRGLESNDVNGSEKRLLNGRFLSGPNLYLISSTSVADPLFGPSFEILVPPVIEYGSSHSPQILDTLESTSRLSWPGPRKAVVFDPDLFQALPGLQRTLPRKRV